MNDGVLTVDGKTKSGEEALGKDLAQFVKTVLALLLLEGGQHFLHFVGLPPQKVEDLRHFLLLLWNQLFFDGQTALSQEVQSLFAGIYSAQISNLFHIIVGLDPALLRTLRACLSLAFLVL
jgi:hypothetical protein